MHSHHSHSGDYVSHATDTLEEIVSTAESKGFTHFCLTEHMPRLNSKFLYPEEIEKDYTCNDLKEVFTNYLKHALQMQKKYNLRKTMRLLVGFEVEGVDDEHIEYSIALLRNPSINMCVGSVHYVNGIPIDFSKELWLKARDSTAKGTVRCLFKNYFDLQYKVLSSVQPQVVGHFDLIRLFEQPEEIDFTTGKMIKDIVIERDWPEVWDCIIRNIKLVADYGGLFELNSAAIRKGWKTPYPKRDICEAIKRHGNSMFCFSDDSHSVSQVGLNYSKVWKYAKDELELEFICYLDLDETGLTVVKKLTSEAVDSSLFWNNYT
ncbi:uncharacterized protein PRCAT00002663001 [Priceomyces carsonii]|uniref:uncharacterized protein n=1 Tax=Priceomyces carsonii TaxID=28549 RepID=UPI002EDAE7CA|nr:unnamed protein product [Priceomyces carsonii]